VEYVVDKSMDAETTQEKGGNMDENAANPLLSQLGAVATRLSKATITDLASVIGIDRTYANREVKLVQSFLQGEALAHHLEDSYYAAMGRSVGLKAAVGEDIVPLERD
jgi:hypothetical protein